MPGGFFFGYIAIGMIQRWSINLQSEGGSSRVSMAVD
jgi:hypothetical protein